MEAQGSARSSPHGCERRSAVRRGGDGAGGAQPQTDGHRGVLRATVVRVTSGGGGSAQWHLGANCPTTSRGLPSRIIF